jgi:hypothetical protein
MGGIWMTGATGAVTAPDPPAIPNSMLSDESDEDESFHEAMMLCEVA